MHYMNRDCQVTENGDVYEIRTDGSISKIGTIQENTNTGHSNGWLWFLLIVAAAAVIVFGALYDDANKKAKNFEYLYNDSYYSLENKQGEYSSLQNKYDELSREYQAFKSSLRGFPLIISDISVGNTYSDRSIETNYGGYISSSRTMYLTPQIKYIGLNSGQSITLKVKLYTPDGSLSRGNTSPSGYSNETQIYINAGEQSATLIGWGGSSMGHWRAGKYRYEIWYNNRCIGMKEFTIY